MFDSGRKSHPKRTIGVIVGALLAVSVALAPQAALALTGSAEGRARSSTSTVKPTVVLVHGAWADGSSFAPVTALLQTAGYPTLVAPNPLRGLASDSAYLSAFLAQATSGPVILVGHSYGGAVITNAAASDPDVKALVYVDAFAPDEGESVLQLTGAQPGSVLAAPDPTTVFNFVAYPNSGQDADAYVKRELFRNTFAASLPKAVTDVLAAGQEPVSIGAALGAPSGAPAWKTLPSWFVIGTQDQVIPVAEQRIMAERAGGTTTEIKAPHLSMLVKPIDVTKVIVTAAKSAR